MEDKKIIIGCFGKFSITMENVELGSVMNSAKARELIAFLVTCEGCSVKKTTVCAALWDEDDMSHSVDNLYKLIRKIQKMPIPFHLESKRNIVQLHLDNIKSDITTFLYNIQNRENIPAMESAISVYQGPLFEGEGYEWLIEKEGRFDMLYFDALEYLSDYYTKNGNRQKAYYYEKLVESF